MLQRIYNLILIGFLALFSCTTDEIKVTEPKLDYYIDSFNVGNAGYKPQSKVTYEYNTEGKLDKYTVWSYTTGFELPVVQNYFVFSYDNNQVSKIKGYLPNNSDPYIEYAYVYLSDSVVSKITESNSGTGINSEAKFSYDASNESVKVAYTFSNGGSFEYEFNYRSQNLVSDKTTKGSELCSVGAYSYDQHVNPLRKLGYLDYLLTNLSVNNRLTENINYLACSFPSLEPEFYTYDYNDRGYPTLKTTNYKSGDSALKSQRAFFYK